MDNSEKSVPISRRKALKIGAFVTAALTIGIVPTRFIFAGTAKDVSVNSNHIGFMYNQQLCIGCHSCADACEKANDWEKGTQWRRVLQTETKKAKEYLTISCNHCEKPACVSVCPVRAYSIREKDGIVVHDREKCIGCKYCLYACPYHAPQYSKDTGRVTKCHFCFEQLDQGEKPACVSVCPREALTCGNLTELRKTKGGVTQLKGLPDDGITKPSWVIIPDVSEG